MPKLALEGIRIIDLSMWFAGPMATRLLADMGAEVIKIEAVRRIDPWRGPVMLTPKLELEYPADMPKDRPYNCSPGFNLQNRNKYGITLDLEKSRGKEIFKSLVKISDIVVENYSPRVMSNFGLDFPVLKEINPRLIMMSMPAMGSTGPDRDFVAFGQTIDCLSGMSYLTGYLDEEPMLQSGLAYGDPLSGMNAAFAILSALHHRRRTGEGMHIELSQVEGLVAFQVEAIMDYTMNGRIRERMGNRHPSMAPHGCYRCHGEDEWVVIAISSDDAWRKFCQAMGRADLAEDERFATVTGRLRLQDELDRLIGDWTIKYGSYEIMEILQKAGIPAGPVLDAKGLVEEPHLKARGTFESITHPDAGYRPYVGMYAKFSKTPGSIRLPAPCFGEHNQYILGKMLGLSQEEIDGLEKEGVIGRKPSPEQPGGMHSVTKK
jgi:crotonobetainyl-CoA:carnitine CoA-transferase CaiB-like acyl-CoA transferase